MRMKEDGCEKSQTNIFHIALYIGARSSGGALLATSSVSVGAEPAPRPRPPKHTCLSATLRRAQLRRVHTLECAATF